MTVTTKKRGVFPLHLTPFESYMFVDDSPRCPMTFVVQLEFSGNIDRTAFQDAIDQALIRHPMLTAVIRPAKSSRDCWVAAEKYDSQVDWGTLDEAIYVGGTGEYLNLREVIGFRCHCRHDDQRALATFVFHHSACDGIGAYQFLGEVLWFYARATGEVTGELIEVSEKDLRLRMRASITPEIVRAMDDSKNILFHKTAQPIATRFGKPASTDEQFLFPNLFCVTYDKNQFRELRLQAQENGQTTNDRLLESLFYSMASWNRVFAPESLDDKQFCINMPLDLRQADQPPFSAINLVTSAFVRRTGKQIQNRDELERSLREETMKIKHSRFATDFMRMLVQSPIDLNVAQLNYNNEECHSSAVFSNTGDPTRRFLVDLPRDKGVIRAGNLVLEDINGTPPLRSQTRAAISIFTYRRRLRICLRTDARYFSDEDSQAFLRHFANCFEAGAPRDIE